MTRATHTPGPWHVFREEINAGDGLTVARVTTFVPEYRAQSDANARLMAAAPEMLEALEGLLRLDGRQNLTAMKAWARVVVAKAKGTDQ